MELSNSEKFVSGALERVWTVLRDISWFSELWDQAKVKLTMRKLIFMNGYIKIRHCVAKNRFRIAAFVGR